MDLADLKDCFIPGCFQDRGWDKLVGDLPWVCEPLIWEFYANVVLREDDINCWIKGHEFNIDLEDIDEVLGFAELDHDFTHYKDRMLSIETIQSHIGGVREGRCLNTTAYLGKEGLVLTYPRSLKSGEFYLWGGFGAKVSMIVGCLSIWGRYELVVDSPRVICKMFPYTSICEDQAKPSRNRHLSFPSVYARPSLKGLPSLNAPVNFHGSDTPWFMEGGALPVAFKGPSIFGMLMALWGLSIFTKVLNSCKKCPHQNPWMICFSKITNKIKQKCDAMIICLGSTKQVINQLCLMSFRQLFKASSRIRSHNFSFTGSH